MCNDADRALGFVGKAGMMMRGKAISRQKDQQETKPRFSLIGVRMNASTSHFTQISLLGREFGVTPAMAGDSGPESGSARNWQENSARMLPCDRAK